MEKYEHQLKMSKNIRDYEFRSNPKEITYFDYEPLKLTREFNFFHNKSKFRKELTCPSELRQPKSKKSARYLKQNRVLV